MRIVGNKLRGNTALGSELSAGQFGAPRAGAERKAQVGRVAGIGSSQACNLALPVPVCQATATERAIWTRRVTGERYDHRHDG